ncbi:MAG TPA: MGMT family protein [Propionibacteriaceae bacterium]|nr:MGMT family protein [Propionibacteriaceae bacterium]
MDYVEQVLRAVEAIPAGRACAYSDIAELLGRGGPRRVGQVMSAHGAGVPWWRVVRADGRPVRGLEEEALSRLRAEGAPMRGDRVDLARARFDFAGHPGLDDTR